MRKTGINIFIFCLYGFPFVYFSMYQDFANQSMLGYWLMIAATAFLAFIGQFFSNSIPIILGNLASGIISFYFIGEMAGNERWGGYFKPLSPYQLLLFVTVLNLIPQLLAMKLAERFRNKVKQ